MIKKLGLFLWQLVFALAHRVLNDNTVDEQDFKTSYDLAPTPPPPSLSRQ